MNNLVIRSFFRYSKGKEILLPRQKKNKPQLRKPLSSLKTHHSCTVIQPLYNYIINVTFL